MKPTPSDYRRTVRKHHYLLIAGFVGAIAYSIAALAEPSNSSLNGGAHSHAGGASGSGGGGDWNGPPRVNDGPKNRAGCRLCH